MDKVWKILIFSVSLMASGVWGATVESVSASRCQMMKKANVIHTGAPVPCERLKVVKFSYRDFDEKLHSDGEVVVMDAVASQVADIFDALLKSRYPIHQAKAMEHFNGNDDDSMAANNTSAFLNRAITGTTGSLSIHAYGLALDINPVQNPYVHFGSDGNAEFKPPAGSDYANRMLFRWGKPVRKAMVETLLVDLFARHGFIYWGGYWDNPIDYQHFQTSREMAEFMAAVPEPLATRFFEQHVSYYRACEASYPNEYRRREFNDYAYWIKATLKGESLLTIYRSNPKGLEALIEKPVSASSMCVRGR